MFNRDLVNPAELHTLVPVMWPIEPFSSGTIPAFRVKCPAGFPNPCADYCETALDLHAYLVKHRAATFIFDVCGDSMKNAGIFDGDKIVVDRAVEAKKRRHHRRHFKWRTHCQAGMDYANRYRAAVGEPSLSNEFA